MTLREEIRLGHLQIRVRSLESKLRQKLEGTPFALEMAMLSQKVETDSPEGQAFIAGWVIGAGQKALQIPLLLEDKKLRNFYAAGFFARRNRASAP